MNSQDFRNLQESYMAVYDNGIREKFEFKSWVNNLLEEGYDLSDYTWDELYEHYNQLDEGKLPLDKQRRTKIGNQIGKRLQSSGSEIIGSGSAFMPKGIRNNLRQSAAKKVGEVKKMMGALKSAQKESYDLYDIILSHLLDEGYADTQEQAEVIMVNMSEDWRDSICEGYVPLRTSDDRYDDEGFPTTTRSWSNKMTDARIRVGKVNDRSRKNSGDPIKNLTQGVSAKKRLDAMKEVDDEPESVRANRSQEKAAANRQLGANRRSLQTSLDREHLTKSLKSS